MIAAIMQPYFFPYLGYFQLMRAVDLFVFYDDAQYMKGGWVNRNRILRDGKPAWLTYPVVHDDYRLSIRERRYACSDSQLRSALGKLKGAYRQAPGYASVMKVIAEYLACDNASVSGFNQFHLVGLARRLGITCRFATSSEIQHDKSLTGQARVIDLCRHVGATHYINAVGGQSLYDPTAFADQGIKLSYVQPDDLIYPQFDAIPVPFLSIIDVLMFNSMERLSVMLDRYRLLEGSAA